MLLKPLCVFAPLRELSSKKAFALCNPPWPQIKMKPVHLLRLADDQHLPAAGEA
jgi:hypothetical protein